MSAPAFRYDPWTGAWVTMAPGRFAIGATRPGGLPPSAARCPFCPGHEGDAEPATEELGTPWRARAVLNRFPLTRSGEGVAAEPPPDTHSLARAMPAVGAHEVIVESRRHDRDLADMGADEALDVLTLWRARVRALEAQPAARAVSLFRNKGRRAGSSQPHPHSQVVALPFVPPHVARRAEAFEAHRAQHGAASSLVRAMVAWERDAGPRIVEDDGAVVSYCPYGSPRAWWVRLALDADVARFSHATDAQLALLAARLPRAVARALGASGATDYNVYVADPPIGCEGGFVIEILPRTGGDAGFEVSTGTSVCVVLPERAAAQIRAARSPP
jgi:UDPglucose--hexose-1-phosphate uridylyltransferase